MCLILFAFQQDPDYPLIVAANRDESYQRPTLSAHYWQQSPEMFAGMDLQAGGTWMGITKQGRFAAVTNYREPSSAPVSAISRGELCKNFLCSHLSAEQYLQQIAQQGELFAGFNLVVGTPQELFCYSNRQQRIDAIPAGIHGLSNGLLNEPWPKVAQGKIDLELKLQQSSSPAKLLPLLLDNQVADDELLPSTGIDIETERLLSSRFIQSESYGTRSSTILRINKANKSEWLEQAFNRHGAIGAPVTYHIE